MRTRRLLSGIVLLVVVLLSGYSSAAASGSTVLQLMMEAPVAVRAPEQDVPGDFIAAEAAIVPNVEVINFHSEIAQRDYRIYVTLPNGYSEEAARPFGYPVVYSLDGNWHFAMLSQIAQQVVLSKELKNEVILVSIGYPTDELGDQMSRRAWDYRPGFGAEAFLGFIEEELIPYIDANYLSNARDRTLEGHSYGGLFTLYALFHATDTFQSYIALSPALWYGYEYKDQRVIFDYEAAYASENRALPVELFLAVGELEPESMHGFYMVSNLIEFNEVLESRNYRRLELDMVIMEDVGHCGAYPGAVTRGLIWVID
jgi:uncharacterized protein